ncbi:thiol:disulfide interchange protein DsbA/DsbL [Acinetobacter rudis]|uniref:thiol:disulfide interchange protein DsbA/DsbL n=1 Tax=Acinetobacter rudis TaxID=632955 RepID=UPI00280CEB6F|nr:thiol:disulfide interchange protein DsbA/DsbL [Acinetobacter rudis]MDQ8951503.1 thiol:disulfide interchange protein DsbA/DsbL [Acinetobacter rudis]
MKKLNFFHPLILIFCFNQTAMAAGKIVEGQDYIVLAHQGKTDYPSKIEVREFFSYGCSHCFALEKQLQPWLKKGLPKHVYFIRTPAAMNPTWEQSARGYYTAESLGIRQKTHIALFNEIQLQHKPLFDQKSLAKFYVQYGANLNQFNQLFNSPAISKKIEQSNQLAKLYQLTGVPSIVINGKYLIQGSKVNTTEIMDYLIEKERQ